MSNLLKAAVLGLTLAVTLHSTAAEATDAAPVGSTQSQQAIGQALGDTWKNVPTQTITAGGVNFAYRELGKSNGGTPVVFLVHLAAVLDNWNPLIRLGKWLSGELRNQFSRSSTPPVHKDLLL